MDLAGIVRRRFLVNWRAPADAVARWLPAPFAPKLVGGEAMVGVCLIRLERLRPRALGLPVGVSGEYAAHRVAVAWEEDGMRREGVYIPRRDSAAWMHRVGLPLASPVRLHPADFHAADGPDGVSVRVRSHDGVVDVALEADNADGLSPSSRFAGLDEASRFFEEGADGFSPVGSRLDGIRLHAERWVVRPLAVRHASSTYFPKTLGIPADRLSYDCALAMRNTPHVWTAAPSVQGPPPHSPVSAQAP